MTQRPKFTLVHLLVVVTIVGMLVALMLSAAQPARHAGKSRRASAGVATSNSSPLGQMASEADKAARYFATPEARVKGRFVNFQAAAAAPRRIIYDADVNIVVKKVTDAESEITKLLKQADGYIAESNVDRTQGEELTGHWKVRIPVAKFETFIEAVSKLGVAESRKQTAQDVTEEFVDLEAQITNKKKLEERIVALLKDSSGKIKDVIEVERELARVRGEIEQMEGRLRYLTNRTDFTTVSIAAREQENYVPPAAPTFTSRIAQAWSESLQAFRAFGEQTAIAAVYIFPWLAVLSVISISAFLYMRRRNRSAVPPSR
jgi:uncharacterized coiled-coil protein SlyX